MIMSLKQREIKFKPRILEPQHIQVASASIDVYGDPQILFQNLSLSMHVVFQENYVKLSANGRNNSQHCLPNNVGSCCVRLLVTLVNV